MSATSEIDAIDQARRLQDIEESMLMAGSAEKSRQSATFQSQETFRQSGQGSYATMNQNMAQEIEDEMLIAVGS